MKKLLIFAYILTVLLFAGFARSEVTSTSMLVPQSAHFNTKHNLLYLNGLTDQSCLSKLTPHFEVINQNTAEIKFLGINISEICNLNTEEYFEVAFDVKTLGKMARQLNLNPLSSIQIQTQEGLLELPLLVKDLNSSFSFSSVSHMGLVLQLTNDSYALLTADENLILLNNTKIKWARFLNQNVVVFGHDLPFHLPVVELGKGNESDYAPESQLLVTAVTSNSL